MRPADHAARRRAAVLVAAAIALAGLGVAALQEEAVGDWLRHGGTPATPRARALLFLTVVLGGGLGPSLLFGGYLWKRGADVVRAGEYPVPGARVIRDTPVLRGAAAVGRGRMMQTSGAILVTAVCVTLVLAWRLASVVTTLEH